VPNNLPELSSVLNHIETVIKLLALRRVVSIVRESLLSKTKVPLLFPSSTATGPSLIEII
jgi:hypothetical protein